MQLVELKAVLEKQTVTWLSWSSALKPRSPLCCFSLRPTQLSIYAWKPEAASFSAAASSLIKHEHWWRQRPALRWVSLLSRSRPLQYKTIQARARDCGCARTPKHAYTHTDTFLKPKWLIVQVRWVNPVQACPHIFMVIHSFISKVTGTSTLINVNWTADSYIQKKNSNIIHSAGHILKWGQLFIKHKIL